MLKEEEKKTDDNTKENYTEDCEEKGQTVNETKDGNFFVVHCNYVGINDLRKQAIP